MKPAHYIVTCLFFFASSLCQAQINFDFAEGMIQSYVENPWDGSFAAGLNGKSGNSNNLDINMTLNLTRETETAKTALLASYFYASNDVSTTTDRFFGQGRQERKLLRNPRWSWFYQVQVEADRFKAYDYRIALHSGLGFEVYKNDLGFLNLRLGFGASREVGGADDSWTPELQLGGDWERKLSENLKLFATADYYPSFDDFADYRIVTNTGLEYVIDAERNINFRMFALNRYDSTPPAGNKKSDIDYGMALVLGF